MATNTPTQHIDQTFPDTERLFRRVLRKMLKPDGKAIVEAFELPDMSVNRERFSTAEDTRRGFRPEDWGVVSFLVGEMPPREAILHIAHCYHFRARHVPVEGNFAHAEVRVWRDDGGGLVLVTSRAEGDFGEDDPDRNSPRTGPDALDPDFHMRWRWRIARRCRPELR